MTGTSITHGKQPGQNSTNSSQTDSDVNNSGQNLKHGRQEDMSAAFPDSKKRKILNCAVDLVPTPAQVDMYLAKNSKSFGEKLNLRMILKNNVKNNDHNEESQNKIYVSNSQSMLSSIPKVTLHISTTDSSPFAPLQLHHSNSTINIPSEKYYDSLIQQTSHFYNESFPKELLFKFPNETQVAASETLSNSSSSDCQASNPSVHDLRSNNDDEEELSPGSPPPNNEGCSFPILGPSNDPIEVKTVGNLAFCSALPRSILLLLGRDDGGSKLENVRFSFEEALSLSPRARIVVESEHPFRIVHANAEFHRLGADADTKLTGKPLSEAESTLETIVDSLVTKHTFADTNKVVLPEACAKLFEVGKDDESAPSHYLIQLETHNSLNMMNLTKVEHAPLLAVG